MFSEFYWKLLYSLRQEYWVLNCGLDAYLYLLFQRKMLKLMAVFSVVALTIPLPVNVYTAENQWDFFEKITLSSQAMAFKSWIYVILVIVMTVLTLWMLMDLKQEAREVFVKTNLDRTKTKNTEWLMERTIHVRGLAPMDK